MSIPWVGNPYPLPLDLLWVRNCMRTCVAPWDFRALWCRTGWPCIPRTGDGGRSWEFLGWATKNYPTVVVLGIGSQLLTQIFRMVGYDWIWNTRKHVGISGRSSSWPGSRTAWYHSGPGPQCRSGDHPNTLFGTAAQQLLRAQLPLGNKVGVLIDKEINKVVLHPVTQFSHETGTPFLPIDQEPPVAPRTERYGKTRRNMSSRRYIVWDWIMNLAVRLPTAPRTWIWHVAIEHGHLVRWFTQL